MSIRPVQQTENNYVIEKSIASTMNLTAEKIDRLEMFAAEQELIPEMNSPFTASSPFTSMSPFTPLPPIRSPLLAKNSTPKRRRVTTSCLGSPMGTPITSPEKDLNTAK